MKRSKQQVSLILNEDLEDVGFAGELVVAKPGFARNFLLVRNRADIATPERRKQRETDISQAVTRREEEREKLAGLAGQLQSTPIELTLKVGLNDQVFGSVSAADIIKELKSSHQLKVKSSHVSNVPLKSLGSHTVPVKLGIGVTADVPVVITADRIKPEEPEVTEEK